MGQHGQEMLKALSWFCQMEGYSAVLNAVDQDPEAKSRFTALCPELMSRSSLPQDSDGEARCTLQLHGGMNVFGDAFAALVKRLPDVGYIFVALGDDDINIRAALMLRMLYHRMDRKPMIQAIVFDPDKTDALRDISNFKGEAYKIDFIGDLRTQYSEKVIINSELEAKALRLHTEMYGGSEDQFWAYEYNYRSSIAAVLHYYARKACGVPMDKQPQVEHTRWNTYMRSEGYVYSGSREKKSRSDLGKKHFSMVDWALLTAAEQEKDKKIADLQKWLN